MVKFIQEFTLDESLVDYIVKGIKINNEVTKPSRISVDIPELYEPITNIIKDYVKSLGSFNYFTAPLNVTFKLTTYLCSVPPWNYATWKSEHGLYFNFYIFLNDSDLIYEFFNPFTKITERFKAKKCLVVVMPSIWMIVSRHSSTRHTNSIYIMGCANITDFYNQHETTIPDAIT